jgi:surfactin synthase thioesterase subunit
LLRVVLPPLEADAELYRGYAYQEDEPLSVPIRAYGGALDPHVTREQLEAWRAQTSGSFELRLFPGGHFYLREHQAELLDALGGELAQTAR